MAKTYGEVTHVPCPHDSTCHFVHVEPYGIMACMACGKPLEHRNGTNYCCHKCSPRTEAGRLGAERRAEGPHGFSREPAYGTRLAEGFSEGRAANRDPEEDGDDYDPDYRPVAHY